MRVLVTGASGLIGSAVCDTLLARGDEVAGLSREPARARNTNPTVAWHAWNPVHERPPEAAFEGIDAVVNLIGESIDQRLTPAAKQRIRDSRVRATKNLVDGMLAAPATPGVLVSQCAVGYYGDRGEAMVDESTPPAEDWTGQLCLDWENAALAAADSGIRVAVLRSAPVLDPDGGLLKQLLLPFKLGVGGPLAGGRQYMPWIHRDDDVGLILWALERAEVEGPLNAAAPGRGHQPRVLEGARQGARPAGGHARPPARARCAARRGARRPGPGKHSRRASQGPRSRVHLSLR